MEFKKIIRPKISQSQKKYREKNSKYQIMDLNSSPIKVDNFIIVDKKNLLVYQLKVK